MIQKVTECELSNAVGRRYAKALFELSKEGKSVDKVSQGLAEILGYLKESPEMQNFVSSPLYARDQQRDAIRAVVEKAKLDPLLSNTLGLMAEKGRLGDIDGMAAAFAELVSAEQDEVVVEVTSAKELTAAQSKKLASTLKEKLGKDVTISASVDPEILGGLVVNIGSTMIDNSVKGKLSKLHNAMKEVG